jgi:hypothetical protein
MPKANEPTDTEINNTKFNTSAIAAAFAPIPGSGTHCVPVLRPPKNLGHRPENLLLRFSQKKRRVDPCFY